ncbi:mechanosensitive ion channel domain-containing protein [Flavihumibacter petaseus]|uniref:MscS family protein n=1 Tax=Flavihumibacter petaseus NBRC 106054 TaxID=1220578 RepID=A0A0E9N4Y9_9BACT|nr:mechanosensitive ion channel domain-containing protein [Flavihumibacter petaseus]GAO44766.1 MscS family protein [Flavihumibacter petaseus NBRC 106054]
MKYRLENNTHRRHLLLKFILPAIFNLFIQATAFSQEDTAGHKAVYDSVAANYNQAASKLFYSISQSGAIEEKKNIAEYNEDTLSTRQDEIIEEIKRLTLEAKSYLEKGLDTTGLSVELKKIEHWYEITSDGVFVKTGSVQTNRNLQTSYEILRELLTRTLARKSYVDDYYRKLVSLRNTIDSLYTKKVLYTLSTDSAVLMRYVNKLTVVSREIKPIDSSFKLALTNISDLQTTVNKFVNTLNASLEKIETFQEELSGNRFRREVNNLGGAIRHVRPFNEIIEMSLIKGGLALTFYVRNEISLISLLLLLVVLAALFLSSLKRRFESRAPENQNLQSHPVLRYPVLSAIVIILNLFQFIFPDPPFIFIALLWTISALALTILFRKFITGYWMRAWLVMFALFLLGNTVNLLLPASRPERWIILTLSIAGILAGLTLVLMGRRHQLKEKLVIGFIAFVVILQAVSVFANIYGRYNLSKTCMVSGFLNVVLAILFFWTIRLLNESILLAREVYNISGTKVFNINFDSDDSKAPSIFYVFLIIGWFVLFARNFYAFRLIADPIKNFISQKRTIGDFSITIGSVLQFFLILYLSGMISKIISFFASHNNDTVLQKAGIGSWLLLIRISIITIGLLLAFAVLGVPMDRLTIILSALGVGIGFGLQSLVNNLVSGLIISFEKPVNVGDVVEIGGQSGTVKSIGFRSSVIATGLGSDVIIPNGNVLNNNLVNWTRDNSSKSIDIIVSVAHGTDLQKVIQVLKQLPGQDDRVLKFPRPVVLIKDYKENTIDLQLQFWAKNIREWAAVKSDIILAMDSAFQAIHFRPGNHEI